MFARRLGVLMVALVAIIVLGTIALSIRRARRSLLVLDRRWRSLPTWARWPI